MHVTDRAESSVYSWTCRRRAFTLSSTASVTEIELDSRSLGSVVAIVRWRVPLVRDSVSDSVLVVTGDVKHRESQRNAVGAKDRGPVREHWVHRAGRCQAP